MRRVVFLITGLKMGERRHMVGAYVALFTRIGDPEGSVS